MLKAYNLQRLTRYHHTALAIGFVELLGNERPNARDIRIAELVVKHLKLSWDDCQDTSTLKKALKSYPH